MDSLPVLISSKYTVTETKQHSNGAVSCNSGCILLLPSLLLNEDLVNDTELTEEQITDAINITWVLKCAYNESGFSGSSTWLS